MDNYRQTALVGNIIDDHSHVVGAEPVDDAPTTSLFCTLHLATMDLTKTTATRDAKYLTFRILCIFY